MDIMQLLHAWLYMYTCPGFLWFPLQLHGSGSGLRLNEKTDLKLLSRVGALCLSLAGPNVAQLEFFASSDYLWVIIYFIFISL